MDIDTYLATIHLQNFRGKQQRRSFQKVLAIYQLVYRWTQSPLVDLTPKFNGFDQELRQAASSDTGLPLHKLLALGKVAQTIRAKLYDNRGKLGEINIKFNHENQQLKMIDNDLGYMQERNDLRL